MFWKKSEEQKDQINRLDFSNDYEYTLNILGLVESDLAEIKKICGECGKTSVIRTFHRMILNRLSEISKNK